MILHNSIDNILVKHYIENNKAQFTHQVPCLSKKGIYTSKG